jgi:hypothetical protein
MAQGKMNMTHSSPNHISEDESDRRAVKAGWYEMTADGRIGAGPFASWNDCFDKISARTAVMDSYYKWRDEKQRLS